MNKDAVDDQHRADRQASDADRALAQAFNTYFDRRALAPSDGQIAVAGGLRAVVPITLQRAMRRSAANGGVIQTGR